MLHPAVSKQLYNFEVQKPTTPATNPRSSVHMDGAHNSGQFQKGMQTLPSMAGGGGSATTKLYRQVCVLFKCRLVCKIDACQPQHTTLQCWCWCNSGLRTQLSNMHENSWTRQVLRGHPPGFLTTPPLGDICTYVPQAANQARVMTTPTTHRVIRCCLFDRNACVSGRSCTLPTTYQPAIRYPPSSFTRI